MYTANFIYGFLAALSQVSPNLFSGGFYSDEVLSLYSFVALN